MTLEIELLFALASVAFLFGSALLVIQTFVAW
jgi:hypothetical protein